MKTFCGTSEGVLSSGIGDGDEGSKEEVIDTKAGSFIHADRTVYTSK